jgi:hypothetical protein
VPAEREQDQRFELSVQGRLGGIIAKRHVIATIALVVVALSGFAAPAGAKSAPGHAGGDPGRVSIVADNLNNPAR